MNIKFVDLNGSLVKKVAALGIESVEGDYFVEAFSTPHPVLMTASNPMFTFGGGIDAIFQRQFPLMCQMKSALWGKNERISNVCFCMTVNGDITSSKSMINSAISFALGTLIEGETLVLSGVGTGIGGLSEDDFIAVLNNIANG